MVESLPLTVRDPSCENFLPNHASPPGEKERGGGGGEERAEIFFHGDQPPVLLVTTGQIDEKVRTSPHLSVLLFVYRCRHRFVEGDLGDLDARG